MGIFRRTHKVQREEKGHLVRLETNAPEDWPDVYVTDSSVNGDNINSRLLSLAVGAALEDGFRAQGRTASVSRLLATRLHEEGILEIPIQLTVDNVTFSIFVYPVSESDIAAEFSGVEQVCRDLFEAPPIFYAAERLEKVAPANPLRAFGADVLSKLDGDAPGGQYAMWWASSSDAEFGRSPTIMNIRRTYRALDGIESYVFASLLRALGVTGDYESRAAVRIALPAQLATFEIKGPEDVVMSLSASAEKGMRFHFAVSNTRIEYRDRFWKLFAEYAETWRGGIEEKKWPKDSDSDRRSAGWWAAMECSFRMQEDQGSRAETVGVLLYP